MKPMNWLMLFLMMNLMLMIMNIINYFFINYYNKNLMNIKKMKNNMNWKW